MTKFGDRVMESTTSVGTGDLALDGAFIGAQRFGDVCEVGDQSEYLIFAANAVGNSLGAWEQGIGTYSALDTLTRTTVLASSNGGAAVDFASGTKRVMLSPGARWHRAADSFASTSIRRYGAQGNSTLGATGGSDDTQAFLDMCEEVTANGGGLVYVDDGFYRIDGSQLVLPANFKLVMSPNAYLVTNRLGGGGANLAEDVANGSMLFSNWPSNGSTAANITIEGGNIVCSDADNEGAAFYDNGGAYIRLIRTALTGFKYGAIFDQSEVVHVDLCNINGQSFAGAWLVNNDDLKPGNSGTFTNCISFKRSQINQLPTAYGIADDGGVCHVFEDNNYNGCSTQLRIAGSEGFAVKGGEYEGAASWPIELTDVSVNSGAGVGGSIGKISSGLIIAPAGKSGIRITSAGVIEVGGGICIGSNLCCIDGAGNAFKLSLGTITSLNATPITDGWSTAPLEMMPFGTAAPTAGTWFAGQIVFNKAVAHYGDPFAWRCDISGTPGTWEELIAANSNIGLILPGDGAIRTGGVSGTNRLIFTDDDVAVGGVDTTITANGSVDDAVGTQLLLGKGGVNRLQIYAAGTTNYISSDTLIFRDNTVRTTTYATLDETGLAVVGAATASNLSGTNTGDQDLSGLQPIDADLTAIADLTTTSFGRSVLTLADAAALRSTAGLGTVATLASDTDGALAANSDVRVPTQKAVKTYVDGVITGTLKFKGSTDCSANPNFPAASKGDVYVVSVAGKIGGASGVTVEVGDEYFATADNAGGTQASVGASWDVLERNDTLATVATTGAYSDLIGKPSLAAVATSGSASDLGSGTLPAAQMPALTGDVTTSAGAVATTIANGAVTLAKQANMAAASVVYRKTAGSGAPEVNTLATLKTDLAFTTADLPPNVQSVTSAATVTPTFSNDQVNITAQAAGLTLANWSGSAVPAWGMAVRIKDDGTSRSISYGTKYRAIGVTLPANTVISKTLYLFFIYNSTDDKFDCVGVAQEA